MNFQDVKEHEIAALETGSGGKFEFYDGKPVIYGNKLCRNLPSPSCISVTISPYIKIAYNPGYWPSGPTVVNEGHMFSTDIHEVSIKSHYWIRGSWSTWDDDGAPYPLPNLSYQADSYYNIVSVDPGAEPLSGIILAYNSTDATRSRPFITDVSISDSKIIEKNISRDVYGWVIPYISGDIELSSHTPSGPDITHESSGVFITSGEITPERIADLIIPSTPHNYDAVYSTGISKSGRGRNNEFGYGVFNTEKDWWESYADNENYDYTEYGVTNKQEYKVFGSWYGKFSVPYELTKISFTQSNASVSVSDSKSEWETSPEFVRSQTERKMYASGKDVSEYLESDDSLNGVIYYSDVHYSNDISISGESVPSSHDIYCLSSPLSSATPYVMHVNKSSQTSELSLSGSAVFSGSILGCTGAGISHIMRINTIKIPRSTLLPRYMPIFFNEDIDESSKIDITIENASDNAVIADVIAEYSTISDLYSSGALNAGHSGSFLRNGQEVFSRSNPKKVKIMPRKSGTVTITKDIITETLEAMYTMCSGLSSTLGVIGPGFPSLKISVENIVAIDQ